ncbi:MAG: excisionase [Clostridium sp.]|nr:excisionase [Clostridium sp.]
MALNQYRIGKLEDIAKADIITIPEAAAISCIGINTMYKMAKKDDADYLIHVGGKRKRTLVDRKRFLAYIRRM